MPVKDFDALLAKKARVQPTFKVCGEEFTCRARLPHKQFQRLINFMQDDEVTAEDATNAFFSFALVRDDLPRFMAIVDYDGDDDEKVLDNEIANDIVQWLLEIYTGKAAESGPTSSDGSTGTPGSRKVVSLSSRTPSA